MPDLYTPHEIQLFWWHARPAGDDECWIWEGNKHVPGYGKVTIQKKTLLAHRVAYHLEVGTLDPSLVIDHLCNEPACVNPRHLRQCTARENVLRSRSIQANNARKTHCKNGHPLDIIEPTRRRCSTCRRLEARRQRARKKALCLE